MSNKQLLIGIVIALLLFIGVGVFVSQTFTEEIVFEPENQLESEEIIIDGKDFSLVETEAINFPEIAHDGLPVMIDYCAQACEPCQSMSDDLKTIHKEMVGKAYVKYVDVWLHPDAGANVPFYVIPTQVFFDANGKPYEPSPEIASKITFSKYVDEKSGEVAFCMHYGVLTANEMRTIFADMNRA